ncbi:MAG: tyrosine-type recombinase/integrase [Candidatus Woesearchaeota archaeon]
MGGRIPITDYLKKAELSLNRILDSTKISEKNKADLNRYLNALDVSHARIDIICSNLYRLFTECDDLLGAKDDRDYMNSLFRRLKMRFSDASYNTLKNVGKAFVRWHNDGDTPIGWKDIKNNGKTSSKRDLKPEDMVTWEDGLRMAEQTQSTQLKAILMTQLDGGFRPSEFIDLKYGDIKKEGRYLVARVRGGKTGGRDVILFRCLPQLQNWLRNHPVKRRDAPLWVMEVPGFSHRKTKSDKLAYRYPAVLKRIKKLAAKADIDKPMDFYNLRHSSAVIKKLDNIPVDIAATNMGHSVRHFTETYGRLSLKDITKRYDKAYDLEPEEEEKEEKPAICKFCDTANDPDAEFCVRCNNPLNLKIALQESSKLKSMEEEMARMKQHFKELIEKIDQPRF